MREEIPILARLHLRPELYNDLKRAYNTQNIQLMYNCVNTLYYAFVEELSYTLLKKFGIIVRNDYDGLTDVRDGTSVIKHQQLEDTLTMGLFDYGVDSDGFELTFTNILQTILN